MLICSEGIHFLVDLLHCLFKDLQNLFFEELKIFQTVYKSRMLYPACSDLVGFEHIDAILIVFYAVLQARFFVFMLHTRTSGHAILFWLLWDYTTQSCKSGRVRAGRLLEKLRAYFGPDTMLANKLSKNKIILLPYIYSMYNLVLHSCRL